MELKTLKIKNFKAIKECEINLNSKLNLFTGVNNCGKTTILEALALWNEIFYKLLSVAVKNSSTPNIQSGNYKFSNKTNYFDYVEFNSIKIVNYSDIFHNLNTKDPIEISLTLISEKEELEISFTIKNANGKNFVVYLTNYDNFDYGKFNLFFKNRNRPISMYFANPINHLNKSEEKKVNEVVDYLINSQNSEEVFRNRLSRIKRNPKSIEDLERDLAYILGEENTKLSIQDEEGIYQKVFLQIGDKTIKDISLYGSGTLQILQFLINIYEESASDIKMILFDEPDSHIHRNIQKKLIEILLVRENIQLFLTTHNEAFIRSTDENSLFHIEGIEKTKVIDPIGKMISLNSKSGITQTGKNRIIKELSGDEITGLHFIEALEADRIIFVEGKMDAEFLEAVFDRPLSILDKKKNIYWVFDGVDSIFKNILKYREVFTAIKNGKNLWEKTYLLIDRDYLNDDLRDKLSDKLSDKSPSSLNIRNHITEAYCMDTIFLKELDKLAEIIIRITNSKTSRENIIEILQKNIELEISNRYNIENIEQEFKKVINKIDSSEFFKNKSNQGFFKFYGPDTYKNSVLNNSNEAYKFLTKDSFETIIEKTYKEIGEEFSISGFLREVLKVIRIDPNLRPREFEEILAKFR